MEEEGQRGRFVQGVEGLTDTHGQRLRTSPMPAEPVREGAGEARGWRPNIQAKIVSGCRSETSAEPGPGAEKRG